MKQTRKSRLKSWKVTFRQGDAILRVYVHAINEATAKRKVEKQVPSCQVISPDTECRKIVIGRQKY
jgi:hypothetical protein